MKSYFFNARRHMAGFLSIALVLSAVIPAWAQTKITLPKNKYKIQDDLEIGRQGSQEVRKQMPTLPQGSEPDRYVEAVGRRLVEAIPAEFFIREFEYSFDVVNARDINAFALPGGPMFVNRGMIEASKTEGEMAGVMAHEISHVVLRHGTAQQTKATSGKVLAGVLGGMIAGAVIGGAAGEAIMQGTQIGASAYILKYGREYETQSDVLGAQIMARAGYDPRDLANMFKTIEQQSGGAQGPVWLSSHPNPGNRFEKINKEAAMLQINRNARIDTREYDRIKGQLRGMQQAPTMAEIAKQQQGQGGGQQQPVGEAVSRNVERPSGTFRAYNGGNVFQLQVPDNWREWAGQGSVTYAPRGGHGDLQGQVVTTHGSMVGAAQVQARDLQTATDQFVGSIMQSNNYLQKRTNYRRATIDGRNALGIALAGRSPATGNNEAVTIVTTQLRNGALFYVINVVPEGEYNVYAQTFENILRSIRLGQ
ncbi:MAG: M48 family metalloprotease [Blastocatellia bacterium]